ncbi:hypothetical protein POM88_012077 [Heracleum sosnowskyi]|uniref:Replication protein A 70 kDa DNA-binding subunit B/D first OB fold domain-containing protein n=1 Tax=Heracleum sosnowskyi TaxID=360622 RepID=A0AAD8IWM6_9APIA|nr:hypothetical protein POM88_012077 [Heracleum sosnowskyi]
MSLTHYHSLDELQPIPYFSGKIKVKVSRRCNLSQQGGGLTIILIDEREKRMHAWIPSQLINKFSNHLLVGETYEMRNFLVTPFTAKYKCLEAHKRIVITQLTRVTTLPPFERVLQDEVFHFTHFYALMENYFQDSHCIDVVGILHKRKRLRSLTNKRNEEQTYLDLVLSNTVTQVKVRLWEEIALQCNIALNNTSLQHVQQVILILSTGRMIKDKYTGEITIYDSPVSKFYINHDMGIVRTLRARFLGFHGV